jgi:hypothetical protein
VERRRRDNINDRIQELADLIPDCLPPTTATTTINNNNNTNNSITSSTLSSLDQTTPQQQQQQTAAGMKAHKGTVLKKSTEYIRFLQKENGELSTRVHQLEMEVAELKRRLKGE